MTHSDPNQMNLISDVHINSLLIISRQAYLGRDQTLRNETTCQTIMRAPTFILLNLYRTSASERSPLITA